MQSSISQISFFQLFSTAFPSLRQLIILLYWNYGCPIIFNLTVYFFFFFFFSLNWPAGPIRSSSCDVCIFIYMSPSHTIFFEASHWPSGHMTRSQASHWSCDLWANERPRKKLHGEGTHRQTDNQTNRQTDIATLWLNRPSGPIQWKSRIRETLNLLTDADHRTDNNFFFWLS